MNVLPPEKHFELWFALFCARLSDSGHTVGAAAADAEIALAVALFQYEKLTQSVRSPETPQRDETQIAPSPSANARPCSTSPDEAGSSQA